MNRGPQMLAEHADVFKTKVGAAFPGSHTIFLGQDLLRDLKDMDWLALCTMGIMGRPVPPEHLKWFSQAWVRTSYPDARLWNNRVAALAGTTRSTPNLAISAAQAVSEAAIFGRGNEFRALDFFLKTRQILDRGTSLADHLEGFLGDGGRMPGYGRPIASKDERIPLGLEMAKELGVGDGPHVALAFEIDRYFASTNRPLQLNMGGLGAAFAADFGWTPQEFNLFMFITFLGGMYPCYVEATSKPPAVVFPMRCSDVRYDGVARRNWAPTTGQ